MTLYKDESKSDFYGPSRAYTGGKDGSHKNFPASLVVPSNKFLFHFHRSVFLLLSSPLPS
jgi:hypothetical protein